LSGSLSDIPTDIAKLARIAGKSTSYENLRDRVGRWGVKIPEIWYRLLIRLINRIYFSRLSLLHSERLPQKGEPVLYVGLHRNGAVDGFVYSELLSDPLFVISTQLTRNWFSRLYFHGIEVTRKQDEGNREDNDLALSRCVEFLSAGKALFIFPEGTSSLGPHHLPFRSGAARIALSYLDRYGAPLKIIPVGIHYECPWGFRSRVEVVLGTPLSTELDSSNSPVQRLTELKKRLKTGLEEVGINVETSDEQVRIQRLAYAATLGTSRSYFDCLKAFEGGVPSTITDAEVALASASSGFHPKLHQGIPLTPMSAVGTYILLLLILTPVVCVAMLLNLPPCLAAWWAGRKFPDDCNVISLWRILVGIPAFLLWAVLVSLLLLVQQNYLWLGLYAVFTCLGIGLYYRVKKLGVAVYNGLFYPQLRPHLLAFRKTVLDALSL
jgi:1-acyl-sn-glycerol-3-phosphate acyltransferase